MSLRVIGLALLMGFALAGVSRAESDIGAPAGQLVEAEANRASDSKVVDDAEASDGHAVSNHGPWQPLASVPVPKEGAELTVWIRHKGGPIQLKSSDDGKQTDRQWVWNKPEKWAWSSLGRYKRADLGQNVVLIRGDGDGDVQLDCVVFSSDASARPGGTSAAPDAPKVLPADRADPSKASAAAKVDVHWADAAYKVPAAIWGVNDYESLYPGGRAGDAGFQSYLTSIKPALVRLHEGGLTDQWTSAATRDWDVVKIHKALAESGALAGAKLMVNVPHWPAWMKPRADGTLAPEDEEELVKLVARLATVLKDAGRNVVYLEVLNELDDTYEKAGKLDALWRLHRRIIVAAKQANPALKVGGPAFTWPKPLWVDGFLAECADVVDFVSWHSYASGDIYDSNAAVFARADAIQAQNAVIAKAVRDATKGRSVELFLSEYNVKWTWEPIERRHGNSVGAIFQAAVLQRAAAGGLSGVTVWHVKGNAYGLIGGDDKVRTTGQFYILGRKYLVGDAVTASSDNPDVEPWAVRAAGGERTLLLANKADHTVVVALNGTAGAPVSAFRLDADGLKTLLPADAVREGKVEVPGYALVFLVFGK